MGDQRVQNGGLMVGRILKSPSQRVASRQSGNRRTTTWWDVVASTARTRDRLVRVAVLLEAGDITIKGMATHEMWSYCISVWLENTDQATSGALLWPPVRSLAPLLASSSS